jgi:hypothetical protein
VTEIIARLTELWNAIQSASLETIAVGVGAILVIVIAILIDKLINGPDVSNTWRRHDGRP